MDIAKNLENYFTLASLKCFDENCEIDQEKMKELFNWIIHHKEDILKVLPKLKKKWPSYVEALEDKLK